MPYNLYIVRIEGSVTFFTLLVITGFVASLWCTNLVTDCERASQTTVTLRPPTSSFSLMV